MSTPSIHEILEKAFNQITEFHGTALTNVDFQYSTTIHGELKLIATDITAKTVKKNGWGRK